MCVHMQCVSYHTLSPSFFLRYIKGPMAYDDGANAVYLAAASGIGNEVLSIIRYELTTSQQTGVALPDGLTALSLAFDATRDGVWIVAGNATNILEDGYYLLFLPRPAAGITAKAQLHDGITVRSLGREACSAVSNPGDNWSSGAAFDSKTDVLAVTATCQPAPGSINTHLLLIDVKTATIVSEPMIYPSPLSKGSKRAGQVFGIASTSEA